MPDKPTGIGAESNIFDIRMVCNDQIRLGNMYSITRCPLKIMNLNGHFEVMHQAIKNIMNKKSKTFQHTTVVDQMNHIGPATSWFEVLKQRVRLKYLCPFK